MKAERKTMAKKFKIKKGDSVVVIAGKDKGKTGTVTEVITKTDRVVVGGVQIVKKHQKPTQQAAGGIVPKEASIHISNVALVDPEGGAATKVGTRWTATRRFALLVPAAQRSINR